MAAAASTTGREGSPSNTCQLPLLHHLRPWEGRWHRALLLLSHPAEPSHRGYELAAVNGPHRASYPRGDRGPMALSSSAGRPRGVVDQLELSKELSTPVVGANLLKLLRAFGAIEHVDDTIYQHSKTWTGGDGTVLLHYRHVGWQLPLSKRRYDRLERLRL
eukprot:CAMPEP_0178462290 /NCGR_PEP_ID=MMETSP0689_2-20121128/49749_1 /TAXON_ID=160604 /ORGANISM="Amphidinium massartii, Strain CS-259" /LENGTH=160 /DNA_ID=CAMNT_0020089153 /DNA_START=68 /DNA_END=550 /DNA_ORIENTATION=+